MKGKTEKNLCQALQCLWKYFLKPNLEAMLLTHLKAEYSAFIEENGLEKLYADWKKRREKE